MIEVARNPGYRPEQFRAFVTSSQDQVRERLRAVGNFFRRTERAAVGQPAPQIKTSAGKQILGSSMPGDPPFKITGTLQGGVGFDFTARASSFEAAGAIGVNAYGMETGEGKFAGKEHPSLRPVFESPVNQRIAADIMAGAPAPQVGDIGRAAARQPQKTSQVVKGADGRRFRRTTITYHPGAFRMRRPR